MNMSRRVPLSRCQARMTFALKTCFLGGSLGAPFHGPKYSFSPCGMPAAVPVALVSVLLHSLRDHIREHRTHTVALTVSDCRHH